MSTGRVIPRNEILDKAAERIARSPHALAAQAFFATAPGKELLEVLEAHFIFGRLQGATTEETAFNLGQREVVLYLRRLAHLRERTGQDNAEPTIP